MYHVSFPVAARAPFGIYGSFWPVINRVVMACVWYGVQSWIGGECVQLMLAAIWPSARKIHNGIPNSGTTTFEFLGFFLFSLLSLPAIWFPPHQIRHLFTVKSYVVPVAGVLFLIWTLVKAGGIGPVVKQKNTIHGSKFAWEFIQSLMNCLANFAALIINSPDFSRFSKKPTSALWSQLITIPVSFSITSLIGILVSSASTLMYGETFWSPLEVLQHFLDDASSATRCGVFFIALAFALAQLGTNIAANSLSAGTDMTPLFPRFINIRRGGFICAAVGFAMCPWNLLKSSNEFTTYLSAYSVFLSAIAGVFTCDYYIVRKGWLDVADLYSAVPGSTYMYRMGVNWRGFVAYLCGILPNIVGFVGAVGNEVPMGAMYVYYFCYFAGFFSSGGVYYILCRFFPVVGCPDTWSEQFVDVEDFRVTGFTSSVEVVDTSSFQSRGSSDKKNLDL